MRTERVENPATDPPARVGEGTEPTVETPAEGPQGTPPSRHDGGDRTTAARRWPWLAIIAGLVVIALAVALAAVLSDDGDDDTSAGGPTTVAPTSTGAPAPTTAPRPDVTAEPDQAPGPGGVTTTPSAATIQLTVYFLDDDVNLVPVQRTVAATQAVARAAMTELLRGPDPSEAGGYATTIPAGTRLLDITVDDGVATVDLSSEFGSGGGSASMGGRVAQVVYTLTEFDTVDAVLFRIEGQPVEALGGEGIPLTEPQTRADWDEL